MTVPQNVKDTELPHSLAHSLPGRYNGCPHTLPQQMHWKRARGACQAEVLDPCDLQPSWVNALIPPREKRPAHKHHGMHEPVYTQRHTNKTVKIFSLGKIVPTMRPSIQEAKAGRLL